MTQPPNRRLATEAKLAADLADGLGTKVNSSTYTAGLAAKQDAATLAADVAPHVTDGSALDVTLRGAFGARSATLDMYELPNFAPLVAGAHPGNQGLSAGTATTSTYEHKFKAIGKVTAVALAFSNWHRAGSGNAPITVKVSISTNNASAWTPLTFDGGAATATIPIDGDARTDVLSLDIADGADVYVRVYITVSTAGQKWPLGHMCEMYWDGVDQTATSGRPAPTNYGAYGYGPSVILARGTTPATKIVALVGDSIVDGANAYPLYLGGFEQALIAVKIPAVKLAGGGESAVDYATPATRRRRERMALGATHAIVNYGTNDLAAGQAAATVAGNLITVWRALADRGAKVTQATIGPRTTSTDSWATAGSQTPVAGAGQPRIDLNTWLRAGAPVNSSTLAYVAVGTAGALLAGQAGHPLTAVLELADLVESARNSGVWGAGLTNDGIHPKDTTHTNIIKPAVQTWAAALT